MASQISSSTISLSPASNIIATSSTPKSAAITTSNVLQQLQQLQRITQQMPIFMAPSKTTALSANSKTMTGSSAQKSAAVKTNNVFQQLQQLQHISQQIAPSKTTSLSDTSKIIPTTSTAATTNNMQQQLHQPQQIIPATMATQKSSSTTTFSANSNIFNASPAAAKTNEVHQQPQQPRKHQGPRISYILYLHLEEMRKPKSTKLSKAKAKYQLTHELISNTMRTVHKLSAADMEIISQETIYKKNLEREIATEKHKVYMEIYHKQQKANFPKKQQQKPQQNRHHQTHASVDATTMESIPSPGFFSRRT